MQWFGFRQRWGIRVPLATLSIRHSSAATYECVTSGPLVDEMAEVLVEEFGVPEDAVEDLVRVICRLAKVVSTTRFSRRPLPERLSPS